MSDTKTEIKEGKDYDKRKSKLKELKVCELLDIINDAPLNRYSHDEYKTDLIDIILEHNLDLE
jgi:hypothetical protein